jgi:cell filamentation protein
VTFNRYDAFKDPYSYRGSNCLKNKLGLRDQAVLQAFELEMSSLRAEEPLPNGRFGPAHYRQVHRHLFQDVYRWAGRYRTIRTAKDGNWFCFPEYIEREMDQLFRRLKRPPFLSGATGLDFVAAAADFLAELNAIHPFREGNGRTQMAFLHLVALRAGHPLKLERIRREEFLSAMIESFDRRIDPLIAQLQALLA